MRGGFFQGGDCLVPFLPQCLHGGQHTLGAHRWRRGRARGCVSRCCPFQSRTGQKAAIPRKRPLFKFGFASTILTCFLVLSHLLCHPRRSLSSCPCLWVVCPCDCRHWEENASKPHSSRAQRRSLLAVQGHSLPGRVRGGL